MWNSVFVWIGILLASQLPNTFSFKEIRSFRSNEMKLMLTKGPEFSHSFEFHRKCMHSPSRLATVSCSQIGELSTKKSNTNRYNPKILINWLQMRFNMLKKCRINIKASLAGLILFLFSVLNFGPSSTHARTSSTSIEKVIGRDKKYFNSMSKSNFEVVAKESNKQVVDQGIEIEMKDEVVKSWENLASSLYGIKLDTLILLICTSVIIPLFNSIKASPILGFLLTGTLLGPSGLNFINDIHMIDVLGELGIVFFLFEMGLELSLERLQKMKKDVFGLGTSQFVLTAALFTAFSRFCGLTPAAAVTVGGCLSLSSSAFVLQLLKDNNAMGTRHGKASFGILLLQDLAVVPLIVVVELLSKGSTALGKALAIAGVKAVVTLSTMSFFGRKLIDPMFYAVAKSSSQEAFLSIILSTVLLMSFVTQGIGLSDTLGAFLAGLLLAETKYRYQIEADIAPFRGLLLGVFFMTVGFSIDIKLIFREGPRILMMLVALLASKASIITLLCRTFGLSLPSSIQTGLLNAQGGEFAFVALGIAERANLIPSKLTKLLLTTVALSMAATPFLAELGGVISNKIEKDTGYFSSVNNVGLPLEVQSDIKKSSFVVVCGYGRVGKMVCDMLDRQFVKYVAIDKSPQKALDARNKGLPVYFGDITRPDVLKGFDIGNAEACVIAVAEDMSTINRAVMTIRKTFPELPILVRAKDLQHQKRLENMFDNVYAMAPVLPEDAVLLTLPFGGAVLQKIGVSKPEIDAILSDFRRLYIDEKELKDDSFDFLTSFCAVLPSNNPEEIVVQEDIALTDSKVVILGDNSVNEESSIARANNSDKTYSIESNSID